MISRQKKIWLSLSLAIGFIAIRLVYAFFFSGLAGENVILDLPELRLGGPFRHITLFGQISSDGILRNIELALPFATSILVFGLVASFISVPFLRRLAWKFKGIEKVLTTIAIALSSIPHLISSGRKLMFTAGIRGEKRISMLVPLLERVITNAVATGLALARSKPAEHEPGVLRLKNFQIGELGPITATFTQGSIHVITGGTGSGKSTILQAIAGQLVEHLARPYSGQVTYGRHDLASFSEASGRVSLVGQFPKFGLTEEEVKPVLASPAIHRKSIWQLSHGESYQVAVDQELAREPEVLLLDEPAGALDGENLARLLLLCEELAKAGTIVIIAEHRISSFTGLSASYWRIDDNRLLPGMRLADALPIRRDTPLHGNEIAVEIHLPKIELGSKLFESLDLSLRQGAIYAITGANGAGKTTLLNRVAVAKEGVEVHGVQFLGPDPRRIALVPDYVADFFVTSSLREELARADKVAKVHSGYTRETFLSLVRPSDFEFSLHPLDLSVGTQLALATAMQLSHKPQLLLLDEPVLGLDSAARLQLAETLRCIKETGCAVVFATHDHYFAKAIADTVYQISDRKLLVKSEAKHV